VSTLSLVNWAPWTRSRATDHPVRPQAALGGVGRDGRLLAVFGLLGLATVTLAEDRVHFLRPGSQQPLIQTGTVLEFTGRTLRFQPTSGTVRDEPSEQVVQIETGYPEAFEDGRRELDAARFDAADAAFAQALTREHRAWVQREMRAWRIRLNWRRGDWSAAGAEFLTIVRQDAETPHWSVAPLRWTPGLVSEADRQTARDWLQATDAVARLLGASLLLTDAATGEAAARRLDELSRDGAPNVARLARMQRWRSRAGSALSDGELDDWRSEIEQLPRSLRGGPQYLLGRAQSQRSDFEAAAADLLWTGLIYSEHEPTAARALQEAAEALERLGRDDDADRVRRALVERHPWSESAREAEARLQPPEQ
jgi:hypothetical protein